MILHVDMDAFYASVEIRDRPELAGQPVIVGGSPTGRGVVMAANYVARAYGIHSAMPAATAFRLCPELVSLKPRMDHYAAVSRQIRDIFERFTPLVEPLSLDEAFLDATGSETLFGPSEQIGRQIKTAIKEELHLVASVGVAPNKFLAKLASDLEKPDGFVVVDRQRIQEFLDPLPVGRLWGVGRVTNELLRERGIEIVRDIRQLLEADLDALFGKSGRHLWELARGLDDRPVIPDRAAKSISHETTFAADIDDVDALRAWAVELADQVGRRLRRHQRNARTVQIKVRFSDFTTITRAMTLAPPTHATRPIREAAIQLLTTRLPQRHQAVRLLGVGVTNLDAQSQPRQLSLFGDPTIADEDQLDTTADRIHTRFGLDALIRGSSLRHDAHHDPQPRPET